MLNLLLLVLVLVLNSSTTTSNKRRRNTPLTPHQKLTIQVHHESGKSPEQIQILEVLQREDGSPIRLDIVKKWIKRFEDTGSMDTKVRSGRPRKINKQQENYVIDLIKKDDEMTYPVIANKLEQKFNIICNPRTVNNYAINNGYSESSHHFRSSCICSNDNLCSM